MAVFSLLADPAGYIPCSTEDMHGDHAFREHWLQHFEAHFESVLRAAAEQYGPGARERIDACRRDFVGDLHAIGANPRAWVPLDMLALDVLRQEKLIAHGLPDPFEATKARENEASLALYPQVVQELDGHASEREALLLATEGVFAGNIFHLGAGTTTKMFAEKSPDFLAIRDGLDGKRPWLVDHFDAMAEAILSPGDGAGGGRGRPRHRQAIFFCDNAGPDLVLGVVPFCRLLARRGTRVLLAANTLPALNDVTALELRALLPRLQALDPVLDELVRAGRMEVIASGDGAPLIDLRLVSDEVNEYARETDLVILEGMGRAVESNFEAAFTVDAIKLAMIKEEIIARRHGGTTFDTVCRFDPA